MVVMDSYGFVRGKNIPDGDYLTSFQNYLRYIVNMKSISQFDSVIQSRIESPAHRNASSDRY